MDIKLNYLHLCDAATIDSFGKLSILGIFTKIYLLKVPSKFLKFTVVGNISFDEITGEKYKFEIRIYDPNKVEVDVKQPIVMELSIPKDNKEKKRELNILLDLGNIEFKSFGYYKLVIFVNGTELGSRTFLVEERIVPKKT